MNKAVRKDLGGEGEKWVASFKLWQHGMEPYIVRTYDISFRAKDDAEAKQKLLKFLQLTLSRSRKKNRGMSVLAWPKNEKKGFLIGNRLVRMKSRYRDRTVLTIKNPDTVFVQGYGPKFADQVYN